MQLISNTLMERFSFKILTLNIISLKRNPRKKIYLLKMKNLRKQKLKKKCYFKISHLKSNQARIMQSLALVDLERQLCSICFTEYIYLNKEEY